MAEKIIMAILTAVPTMIFCGLYFIRIEHRLTKLETQISLMSCPAYPHNPDTTHPPEPRTFGNRFFK